MFSFKSYINEYFLYHVVNGGKTRIVTRSEGKARALRDKYHAGGKIVTKEIGSHAVKTFLKDDVEHMYFVQLEEDAFELVSESEVVGYIKGKNGEEDRPAASAELALDMAHLIAADDEKTAATMENRKPKSRIPPNSEHIALAVSGLHSFKQLQFLPVYDQGKLSHFKHSTTGETKSAEEVANHLVAAKRGIQESRLAMPLKGHAYHTKSDDELHFIIKDAGEAAVAMRGHAPQAESKYLDQVNDASTVLNYRKRGGKQVQGK